MNLLYWSVHPIKPSVRLYTEIFDTKFAGDMAVRLNCSPSHDDIKHTLTIGLNKILRLNL